MIVQIINENNEIIWEHGIKNETRQGMSNKKYSEDGTLLKIIESLQLALEQAEGEKQIGDGVSKLAIPDEGN